MQNSCHSKAGIFLLDKACVLDVDVAAADVEWKHRLGVDESVSGRHVARRDLLLHLRDVLRVDDVEQRLTEKVVLEKKADTVIDSIAAVFIRTTK